MKTTLIGAGNVGHHLGLRFREMGIDVEQVFSRNLAKAQILAKRINAQATNDLLAINSKSDIYIIAVKDDAIGAVARQLAPTLKLSGTGSRLSVGSKVVNQKLIVHTSGGYT